MEDEYLPNTHKKRYAKATIYLEVPDNEPQEKLKQNFETVAESDAYAEGYENGFRAGRCITFDYNKCVTKTNEPQFKPFDKVLVRNDVNGIWQPSIFTYQLGDSFYTVSLYPYEKEHIIQYEGNEYLVGTTDNPKKD